MLRRKCLKSLQDWKSREGHKSLIVRGQRQVGKTFIIQEFSKEYEHSLYVDLSKSPSIRELFNGDLDVDRLVMGLNAIVDGADIIPGALIILDEIQSCPRAKASLKHFTIDGRFDVIASGSLLDIPQYHDQDPLALPPVGFVEELRMYSLDFEEFLWARGISEDVISQVKHDIRSHEGIDGAILNRFNDLFKEFMLIGGMPEAVSAHVSGKGLQEIIRIQNEILSVNREDIAKYCGPSLAVKVRACLDSMPSQLSKTNKKFKYSELNAKGSRDGSRAFSEALDWIVGSGIGNPCYRLRQISYPVSDIDNSQFRMYVSDTGLLVRMGDANEDGNPMARAIITDDLRFNQGALVENVVAECLMKSGFRRSYYINRKEPGRMELDFVTNMGSDVTVIEVKSGKDREAPSLNKTIDDARFQRRIILERSNVHVDERGIEHYPLFAAAFLRCTVDDDLESLFAGLVGSDGSAMSEP